METVRCCVSECDKQAIRQCTCQGLPNYCFTHLCDHENGCRKPSQSIESLIYSHHKKISRVNQHLKNVKKGILKQASEMISCIIQSSQVCMKEINRLEQIISNAKIDTWDEELAQKVLKSYHGKNYLEKYKKVIDENFRFVMIPLEFNNLPYDDQKFQMEKYGFEIPSYIDRLRLSDDCKVIFACN